jgi:2-methylcitrate dehydratase PrpD
MATVIDQPVSVGSFSEALLRLFLNYPTEKITQRAYDAAILCIEDTVGVALAAAWLGVGTSGATLALQGASDESTVWGSGRGGNCVDAALANGMLAHALDFDDTHPAAIMHASAVNVPTALAIAEARKIPMDEMLAALVLGYEISARLGRLGPGPFQDNGFQSTSVLGTFAAVFIASRLLGADVATARNAMGVAGSMAGGLMEYLADASDTKQMHPGWAAQSGIRAVQLAAAGLTGPATVFEGRFGVFKSYARLDIDPDQVLAFDGTRFEIEEMAPKPYPACLCVHPLVQAALELRKRGTLNAARIDAIEAIECEVPQWYVNLIFEPAKQKADARNAYEGRFSGPYCIARAVLDGKIGVESFSQDRIADPRARAIAQKVRYRVRAFPEFPESFPGLIRVIFGDGVEDEAFIPHNLGSYRNPLGPDGIEAKFRDNVNLAVGEASATELHRAIRKLRSNPAGELWSALRSTVVCTP